MYNLPIPTAKCSAVIGKKGAVINKLKQDVSAPPRPATPLHGGAAAQALAFACPPRLLPTARRSTTSKSACLRASSRRAPRPWCRSQGCVQRSPCSAVAAPVTARTGQCRQGGGGHPADHRGAGWRRRRFRRPRSLWRRRCRRAGQRRDGLCLHFQSGRGNARGAAAAAVQRPDGMGRAERPDCTRWLRSDGPAAAAADRWQRRPSDHHDPRVGAGDREEVHDALPPPQRHDARLAGMGALCAATRSRLGAHRLLCRIRWPPIHPGCGRAPR